MSRSGGSTFKRCGCRAQRTGRQLDRARGVDGRQAIRPWLCRFELCCQADECGLITEAAQEVHSDGQAAVVPAQRHGYRGIAGEVGDHARVADRLAADLERPPWILRGRVHRADGRGGIDIVGVRRTSTVVKKSAITRLNRWMYSMASSHSAAATQSEWPRSPSGSGVCTRCAVGQGRRRPPLRGSRRGGQQRYPDGMPLPGRPDSEEQNHG